MLALSDEYVDKLNADVEGGMFLKAVDLVEDDTAGPSGIRHFVDHTEPITFNGNAYEPLKMRWDNLKTSQGMPIEGATVSVSNLGRIAGKYIKQIDVTDNEVTLRLLHLDLLSQTTGHWARKGYVLAVTGDSASVSFTIGRRLGRNVLPRKVYTQRQFPALASEVARIFS